MIQVSVQRRDNDFVMLMLKVSELLRQKPRVVIVYQCDSSHDRCIRGPNRSPNKLVPDKVAKCLGSVIVAFFRDELVKAVEQIRV